MYMSIHAYIKHYPVNYHQIGAHVYENQIDLIHHSAMFLRLLIIESDIYRFWCHELIVDSKTDLYFYRKVIEMPSAKYLDLFLIEYGSILSDQSKWIRDISLA